VKAGINTPQQKGSDLQSAKASSRRRGDSNSDCDGVRNQVLPCRRGRAAIYFTGLDMKVVTLSVNMCCTGQHVMSTAPFVPQFCPLVPFFLYCKSILLNSDLHNLLRKLIIKELCRLSQRANYTDRETVACRKVNANFCG
jgi:hypothetical protein